MEFEVYAKFNTLMGVCFVEGESEDVAIEKAKKAFAEKWETSADEIKITYCEKDPPFRWTRR